MKRLLVVLALTCPLSVCLSAQVSQFPASAIIPVVSSTPGAAGARFRTELQMANPTEQSMEGWLLLRPQLIAVRYELAPHTTRSWADFVAEIGSEGAGSLDVVVEDGQVPSIAVRSFDDQPAGTNGVSVPMVPIEAVLITNDVDALIAPRDPANFRFNIGVRAIDSGAGIDFIIRNAAGAERHRRFLELTAHQFLQQSSLTLLGIALEAGDAVEIVMVSGSAILYGSTVDNRTNDASLQVVRR